MRQEEVLHILGKWLNPAACCRSSISSPVCALRVTVAYIEHQERELGKPIAEKDPETQLQRLIPLLSPSVAPSRAALEKLRYADAELEIRDLKVGGSDILHLIRATTYVRSTD